MGICISQKLCLSLCWLSGENVKIPGRDDAADPMLLPTTSNVTPLSQCTEKEGTAEGEGKPLRPAEGIIRKAKTYMAILKGLIHKMKGSAGDLTFKTVAGRTVVSEKVTKTTNRRTSAQQKQRMKWANVIQMYKGICPLIDFGFENKAPGLSDYNMFVRLALKQDPVYMTRAEVAGGGCIAAPYQITQGTLPAIAVSGEGAARRTDIKLGTLVIDANTTMAELSNAIVQQNADYDYGDQLSYFVVHQQVNAVTGIPFCQFDACAVVLDKVSTVKVWDQLRSEGFRTVEGYLGHDAAETADAVFCWVHSRRNGSGKTLVSTQLLLANNGLLADYTGSDAYQRAVKTYGGENTVFLTPEEQANANAVENAGGNTESGNSEQGSSDGQGGTEQGGNSSTGGTEQGGDSGLG